MEKEGVKEGASRAWEERGVGGVGWLSGLLFLFSTAHQRGHMQNPALRATVLLSHCSRLGKRSAPITHVIFMRKENLKWSSRVHRAFYTGSDPAVRDSSS